MPRTSAASEAQRGIRALLLVEQVELVLAKRVSVGTIEAVKGATKFAFDFLWAWLAGA
jgi:hypothetical protein